MMLSQYLQHYKLHVSVLRCEGQVYLLHFRHGSSETDYFSPQYHVIIPPLSKFDNQSCLPAGWTTFPKVITIPFGKFLPRVKISWERELPFAIVFVWTVTDKPDTFEKVALKYD